MPSLTSFSDALTFFPKWFVKCGRSSSFGLVSRDACNELFRQHRFEKIGESFASVSSRFAFERALETEKRRAIYSNGIASRALLGQ